MTYELWFNLCRFVNGALASDPVRPTYVQGNGFPNKDCFDKADYTYALLVPVLLINNTNTTALECIRLDIENHNETDTTP